MPAARGERRQAVSAAVDVDELLLPAGRDGALLEVGRVGGADDSGRSDAAIPAVRQSGRGWAPDGAPSDPRTGSARSVPGVSGGKGAGRRGRPGDGRGAGGKPEPGRAAAADGVRPDDGAGAAGPGAGDLESACRARQDPVWGV